MNVIAATAHVIQMQSVLMKMVDIHVNVVMVLLEMDLSVQVIICYTSLSSCLEYKGAQRPML